MRMKNITLLLLSALALTSCDKLIEGVVHVVEFPEHTPRISATLIASDSDSLLHVYLSSSAGVLDSSGPQIIQDAVISLENSEGTILHSLSSSNFVDSVYVLDLGTELGMLDGEMTFRASAPDFEDVEAKTTMPQSSIATVEYFPSSDTIPTPWGMDIIQDRYVVDFENDINKHECYLVQFQAKYIDEFSGEESEWEEEYPSFRPDTRIDDLWVMNGLLVSDETTPNNSTGLTEIYLNTENYSEMEGGITKTAVRVRIQSLSDELERYYRNIQLWQDNEYSLFAEPMLMYSNVSSGFGCFGLANEQVIEIDLD